MTDWNGKLSGNTANLPNCKEIDNNLRAQDSPKNREPYAKIVRVGKSAVVTIAHMTLWVR